LLDCRLFRPCSTTFSFTPPAPSHLYTLSLHDALPISRHPLAPPDLKPLIEIELVDGECDADACQDDEDAELPGEGAPIAVLKRIDRKSTRLNSSHVSISYAVFCLKKKKESNNKKMRSN